MNCSVAADGSHGAVALAMALLLATATMAQRDADQRVMREVMRQFERGGLRFNCDSCEGAMNCERYCTDREFVLLDSTLEMEFQVLLKLAPNDTARAAMVRYQDAWVVARREQCRIPTTGWDGSMGAVLYVDCLNTFTRSRKREIAWLKQSLEMK